MSNRASAGVYDDRAGPLLVDGLRELGFVVDGPGVVPDGDPVRAALRAAVAAAYDVVLTTGGTGLTPLDLTPEMTARVIDREVPGIAEACVPHGVAKGVPTAALSRGLAGLAGTTHHRQPARARPGGAKDGLAVLGPASRPRRRPGARRRPLSARRLAGGAARRRRGPAPDQARRPRGLDRGAARERGLAASPGRRPRRRPTPAQRRLRRRWSATCAARRGPGGCCPSSSTLDGRLVGQLTVGGITWGSLCSAHVGYWIDERVAGRGVMPTAVAMAVDHCFTVVGLHRIEINIRPENLASLRVVEKLGLRDEGLRLRYLHIAGAWRDHRSYAVTTEERRPGGLLGRWHRTRTR